MTDTVFLLDVDNTLLDNDAVIEDLRRHLVEAFGAGVRSALLGDLRAAARRARLRRLSRRAAALPRRASARAARAADLAVPAALPVREPRLSRRARCHRAPAARAGRTVILSDGDVVFQPRKIERSGLWAAVDGEVLIYIHKEQMLDDVERRYPARRYVMVDDKLRILAAMKKIWGDRLTTVFVRQGHYANDAALLAALSSGGHDGRRHRGDRESKDLRI